jgi:phosphohistidine phosphatase
MAYPVPSPTRQLWILRHAKAADAPRGGRDRDRPLADRGRRDATALGRRLAAGGPLLDNPGLVRPDLVLCSAAVRTVQTVELILGQLGDRVPHDTYTSLYEAEPDTVLRYLREVDEHARSVLVVGHNPTLFHLTLDLLTEGSDDRDRLEKRGFETCALAVVDLAVAEWKDEVGGQGTLIGLFGPPY